MKNKKNSGLILKYLPICSPVVGFVTVWFCCITQTCPCNILQYFMAVKMIIFRRKFLIFFLFLLKT